MWPVCWTRRVQLSRTPLSATHLHKLLSAWRLHCGVLGYHKRSSFFALPRGILNVYICNTAFIFFFPAPSCFGNSSFWSAYCLCASLNVFSAGAHIPLRAPLGHFVYKKNNKQTVRTLKLNQATPQEYLGAPPPPPSWPLNIKSPCCQRGNGSSDHMRALYEAEGFKSR